MNKQRRKRKMAIAQMLADQGFSGPQIARHSTVRMSETWVYVNVDFVGRGGPEAPPVPPLETLLPSHQPAAADAPAAELASQRRRTRGAGLVAVGATVAGANLYNDAAADSLSIVNTLQAGLVGIGAIMAVAMVSNAYRHRRRKQQQPTSPPPATSAQ